jgi:hypothetical protein
MLAPNDRLHPKWLPPARSELPPVDEEGPVWPPVLPEPPWGGLDVIRQPDREPIIFIGGDLRDGEVYVAHVVRVEAVPAAVGRRVDGLRAELVGRDGGVLARAAVHRVAVPGCGCGGGCGGQDDGDTDQGLLEAVLPDPAARGEHAGAALRIIRDGEEVWRREAPDAPPVVEDVEARLDGPALTVRWRVEGPETEHRERFLRWSADEGRRGSSSPPA